MLVKIISISILLSFTKVVSQTISFVANTEATSIGAVTKSRYGTILFEDIDSDNDNDLLITGKTENEYFTKLYLNNGNGGFNLSANNFTGTGKGASFADIDGDLDLDLLTTGFTGPDPITGQFTSVAILYKNDGDGNFTLVNGTPFEGVNNDNLAFADVDNDDDQDVIIAGITGSNQKRTKLYLNDGDGNFTLDTNNNFPGISSPSIGFSDIDDDDDQDLLLTGYDNSSPIARLYNNDGSGNFTLVNGTPFEGVWGSSQAFNDVDGDDDLDILISGRNQAAMPITKLYINDGSGNFTEKTDTTIEDIWMSAVSFSDIDNDNDNDLLISGQNSSYQSVAKLYENDGTGNFTLVNGTPFEGLYNSWIGFNDNNNDELNDVCMIGNNGSGAAVNFYNNTSQVLSTNNPYLDNELFIYPNPTKGTLTVHLNKMNTVKIIITNTIGKVLKNRTFKNSINYASINLSDLDNGIYFITVIEGKHQKTMKFIKN
ncbi:MAG: T9SS type A sorting domain-containing protein [Flavobacteriaceae bacterium]